MSVRSSSRNCFFKGHRVGVADVNKLNPLRVFLDCIEMIARNAAATDDSKPNLPVNNYRVVMHEYFIELNCK